MILIKRTVACLAAFCLVSGTAWADSVADLKSWLRETRTLKADFAQSSAGGIGGGKSQGTMAISRPGKFRWSINKPYTQLMVGDGSRIWLYDPELKQVIVRKSEKALGGTPAALLAGDNDAEQRFTFKADGEHAGAEWVIAEPKQNDTGFVRIRIGLAGNELKGMVLEDSFGQVTTLVFSNVVRNGDAPASLFRFTPPAGADVLKQ
ncbi:MAG: outer membrane lipoprotein chaperone LolA [Rhodocyclaceae bacterium]|jgi:outer membrane lipoprotein carrier protein|uniref:Outer-membrane lipoprotein carrier protein n=1 Tax=Fluviibacter phosphoraccumulans TaxID=1751046 RepID=A0A679HUB5_9RHOO|nr:outer membrane lipoprotein chaperone LolA [Fluviibacter phosphoraccumulans]MBP7991483.1 outer membrane lipoprotein chaperone LolA [Rhodocyclaceae bacterium]BBU67722.1 outer-membrane lipoprotein carrier protein [Fluviibacter phosphoraccumulans]BBU70739.1 outer-membrane lipoprotein carrier protein [Fluviibacter phosphoraccumulans]BCA65906.1 outer-membrane lipoprotein carrier protein [Fluviibacter phosphoraccumulans]